MSDGFDDLAEAESTFGPGFDLIVGLLAVVLVALQLSRATLAVALGGEADLSYVSASKSAFVKTLCADIAPAGCTQAEEKGAARTTMRMTAVLPAGREVRLSITDIGTNQTLRIGEEVLFDSGQDKLKEEGRAVLKGLTQAVKSCSGLLREIQVQGHADHIGKPEDNLDLAARRAVVVYNAFLRAGIDPETLLMSAATYASAQPVDRIPGEPYRWAELRKRGEAQYKQNRRVEFHFIYRLAPANGSTATCSARTAA